MLETQIQDIVQNLYQVEATIELQETRKEFEGDLTLVVFPFVRAAKKRPEDVAGDIGAALVEAGAIVSYNVVKGILEHGIRFKRFRQRFQSLCVGCESESTGSWE
jgi:arginyl-tRNA synthetase